MTPKFVVDHSVRDSVCSPWSRHVTQRCVQCDRADMMAMHEAMAAMHDKYEEIERFAKVILPQQFLKEMPSENFLDSKRRAK